MTIKGCAKKIKAAPLMIGAAVLGLAFIGLRFWQTASLIDPATGFYTEKTGLHMILFYVLAALLVLAVPVLLYLTPLSRAEGIAVRRRPVHALCSLLFASFSVAAGIKALQTPAVSETVFSEEGVQSFLTAHRLTVIFAVLAFLTAASLVFDAVGFLIGRDFIKKIKLLRLAPPLWAGIAAMLIFTVTVSYLNNSTLLLLIFGTVTLMLFLFAYARKLSSFSGDENSPFFFATGILSSVFLLAASLPTLFKVSEPIVHCDFEWYRVAAALYVISAMVTVLLDKSPAYGEEAAEAAAQTPAEESPAEAETEA